MGRGPLGGLLLIGLLGACAPLHPESEEGELASAGVRAIEVLEHADGWLGKELTVDIYESLYDDGHSSAAPEGGYDVEVADRGTDILNLVPDGRDIEALPEDLEPPFQIRATLERDDYWEERSGRTWRRLVVHDIRPLRFPEPVWAESAEAILRRPRQWHGRYVELEGSWLTGFEASQIDRMWIDPYNSVEVVCAPAQDPEDEHGMRGRLQTTRVRLVGFVYTKGGYGHMGMGKAKLAATKLTFLDTPGCDPGRRSSN